MIKLVFEIWKFKYRIRCCIIVTIVIVMVTYIRIYSQEMDNTASKVPLCHFVHAIAMGFKLSEVGYELIYITNEAVGRVGYYQLVSGKSEKNNCFSKFSSNSLHFFG